MLFRSLLAGLISPTQGRVWVDVRIGANMQETKARVLALRASAIRLRAEAKGLPQLPATAFAGLPAELVRTETDTFYARRRALESNLSSQLQNLKISQQELSITEPLAAKGLVSDIDVLRIQRAIAEAIVAEILVHEGQKVQSGQTLMRLSDVNEIGRAHV